MKLYHFTCEHGHQGIKRFGYVLPFDHPLLGCRVCWFTELPAPDRMASGLTSPTLSCDRMRYRYVVRSSVAVLSCRRWLTSWERAGADPFVVADLESFCDPEHWWVSNAPVLVRRA